MKVHCETPFWSYAKEPHLLVEPHQTLGNGEKTHGSQRKNGGKNLQLMNLCVCVYCYPCFHQEELCLVHQRVHSFYIFQEKRAS